MANNVENLEFQEISEIPVTEDKSGIYAISVDASGEAKAYPLDNFKTGDEVDTALKDKASVKQMQGVQNDLNNKANNETVSSLATQVANSATKQELEEVKTIANNAIIEAIPMPAVDTYNDVSGGKTSLLGTYPSPQKGFRVVIRNDERNSNKQITVQYNGVTWVNLEQSVMPGDAALSGGSSKTLQQVDEEVNHNIGLAKGDTVNGYYISNGGNPTALSAWKYIKFKNNNFLKIKLRGVAYGTSSRTIAFYRSYETISSATYISGYTFGDASGSGVAFDNEIAVPDNTECIVITDRAVGNIVIYEVFQNQWKSHESSNTDNGRYIIVDSGEYQDIKRNILVSQYTESKMTNNGYLKRDNGSFVADSLNISSDFIAVGEEDSYTVTDYVASSVTALAFYDADKVFISSAPGSPVYGRKITVEKPVNAAYYKIGRLKNGVNNIYYTFFFGSYKSTALVLAEDEVAFINNKFADKIVAAKKSVIEPKFKLTDRNDNTFIGAMNKVLDAMLLAKPSARFVIESNFTEDLMANGNGSGKKIIELQKTLADYWGVQFIDISSKLGFVKRGTINTLQTFIKDGTHPSDYPAWDVDGEGNPLFTAVNLIARFVANELKPNFEDWTGKKILYIGTSIPAGYPYTGNPLAQYPKIIARLLGCQCDNKAVPGSVVRIKKVDGSLIPSAHAPFLSLDSSVNYMNSLVNVINNYDLVVFSHGRNDFVLDATDFNIDEWDLTLN